MADDWDTVTVLRKRAPTKTAMKSEAAVNQARRQGGAVTTEQKCKWLRAEHPEYHIMSLIPLIS